MTTTPPIEPVTQDRAAIVERRARKICQSRGINPDEVTDDYGPVLQWHHEAYHINEAIEALLPDRTTPEPSQHSELADDDARKIVVAVLPNDTLTRRAITKGGGVGAISIYQAIRVAQMGYAAALRQSPDKARIEALERIADNLICQKDEPMSGTVGRIHYWRDKAIDAANAIRALAKEPN